jgi:hypothetical protein
MTKLKLTIMTATIKISKSEVMKRAWSFFRKGMLKTFSACLKRAWREVKAEFVRIMKLVAGVVAMPKREIQPRGASYPFGTDGLANHYQNAPVGTYFGD